MKILMVCLGNICRSPLAEGIMKALIDEHRLDWIVESCGTSSFHNGEPPHKGSIDIAASHGIDIRNQRSELLIKEHIQQFDLILAMDASNYNDILRKCTFEKDRKKVKLLMNYAYPNENRPVPDPYYVGGFDIVYNMILEACSKIIEEHR